MTGHSAFQSLMQRTALRRLRRHILDVMGMVDPEGPAYERLLEAMKEFDGLRLGLDKSYDP